MPNEILGENYEDIKEALRSYAKSRQEWDEYAKKLDPVLRQTMARCFAECRDNGFFGPCIGDNGEIAFTQIVEQSRGINELYRVEIVEADGSISYARVAKEFLRPNMKIISKIR